MHRLPLSSAMALAMAAAVAACGASNGGMATISPAAGGGDSTLGQDLAGEPCRGVPRAGASASQGEQTPLDIVCGTGQEPVGALWAAPLPPGTASGDATERHASIVRAAAETSGGRRIAERMSCESGEWAGGSIDLRLSTCTLRGQGWP